MSKLTIVASIENFDPDKHYVVGFSGGKDSVATWLLLTRELQAKHVTCLFADTGHEFDELHEYLDLLEHDHGCPLVRIHATMQDMDGLRPEKIRERLSLGEDWENERLDMERLAILKRRFPSPTVRFCTTILKMAPSRRWMQAHCDPEDTVRVSGVRAQESAARAKRPTWGHDEYMGVPMWLPIHGWTHSDVFGMADKWGVPHNPLYRQGMGRVGCAPCIMARKEELAAMAARKPEAFDRLDRMEHAVADATGMPVRTFFSAGKIPRRFASAKCQNTGKPVPTAEDVRAWAMGEDPAFADMQPLFEEDWTEDAHACSSQYGLCE